MTRKIGLLSRGMEITMRSGAAFILLAVVAALASAKPQNRQIEGNESTSMALSQPCTYNEFSKKELFANSLKHNM